MIKHMRIFPLIRHTGFALCLPGDLPVMQGLPAESLQHKKEDIKG